jgi:hypothetical protein
MSASGGVVSLGGSSTAATDVCISDSSGSGADAGVGAAGRGADTAVSSVVMATRRGGNGMAATIPDRLVVAASEMATFFEWGESVPALCTQSASMICG